VTTDARQARWSVAIAASTLAIQNGIVMAFAVLYLPLVDEFGASRAEVAIVQSAVLLLGGLGAPLVGYGLDRLGARRLLQLGAALVSVGFIAASQVASLPALVITYGVVAGLGLATLGSHTNMVIAALWYPTARARAIAVADLGTGLGAFCFIPLAQALVIRFGWRMTLLLWAVVLLAVVIPMNAFQRVPAAPAARLDRAERSPASSSVAERPLIWSLGEALRFPSFWWLSAVRFFAACAFPLMNTHMVAYAIGQGIAPARAATALGSVSFVSMGGRLVTGWLADRIGRAQTLTVTYASAAGGIVCLSLLAFGGWPGWLVCYVLLYGMAQGSSGIIGSARAADVFAGPTLGTISGWLALASGPGEAIGAWAGGAVYDWTGGYVPAFGVAVASLVAGLVAIWRVRVDPRRAPR
jgi:MFS transporter, OFA family, oxalate/formate antiporter